MVSPLEEKNTTMNGSTSAKRLHGKVAVITGGASGIGECAARLFVHHGAKVVLADIQDEPGLKLCNELNDSGKTENATYVHCDVTADSDVKDAVDLAVSKYGKLDIMFNSAGISGNLQTGILDCGDENFKRVFEVNVFGSFLAAKHAARTMIPAKSGSIVFMSSAASVTSGIAPHPYTTSKHAVVGLMKNLCVELGQHGIRVNCISPCGLATPMLSAALGLEQRQVEELLCAAAVLKGVVPGTGDVAEAAVYLGSDEGRLVSGLNLILDGGYSTTNQSFKMVVESFMSKSKLIN